VAGIVAAKTMVADIAVARTGIDNGWFLQNVTTAVVPAAEWSFKC